MALLNGLGRLAWGSLSDRIGRLRTVMLMFVVMIIAFVGVLPYASGFGLWIVGMCLVGFSFGGFLAVMPSITADFYGTAYLGANYGFLFTAYGISGVVAPFIIDYLRTSTGGFTTAMYIFAGLAAVGIAADAGPVAAVGVVASGLDVVYPRRHLDLHRRVASSGLMVSETPAGVRPDAWRFPARNRLIAGLSDAVVVVESRIAGGSMHTVDEALIRGVPVMAVPGPPGAPASQGTNQLLFDGANLARNAADVLLAIGVDPHLGAAPPHGSAPPEAPEPTPAELSVLDVLEATPSSLAEASATAQAEAAKG